MKTTKNFFWQFFGQGIGKASIFLFYILLPIFIGVEEYGKFSFALTLSLIIVQPTVDMGLDMVIAKWVSRGWLDVVKKAFIIRLTTALIALFLLFITSLFLKVESRVLFMLFVYLVLISFQNVVFSFFRGIENMKIEGIITPIQKSSTLLLLFVFAFLGFKDAFLGPVTLLFSVLFGSLLLLSVSRHKLKEILEKNKTSFLKYKNVIKEGIILGGVAFLWLIYFRIDSLMLGVMKGDFEVGIYNVAYKLMEGVIFVPSIIMIVSFPKLVKQEKFKEIFGKLLFILGIMGLSASIILYLFSPNLIRLIYKPEFFNSITVLQILSLVLFPVFLGHLMTQSLIALDLNKLYLLVTLIGTLLNISLNYLLIPSLGASGAAWATLATEISIVLLCGYFIWKKEPDVLSLSYSVGIIKEILFPIVRKLNL
jgi:O-antigen/teichoic acid export membrane protein